MRVDPLAPAATPVSDRDERVEKISNDERRAHERAPRPARAQQEPGPRPIAAAARAFDSSSCGLHGSVRGPLRAVPDGVDGRACVVERAEAGGLQAVVAAHTCGADRRAGRRPALLINKATEGSTTTPITVVSNWTAGLSR